MSNSNPQHPKIKRNTHHTNTGHTKSHTIKNLQIQPSLNRSHGDGRDYSHHHGRHYNRVRTHWQHHAGLYVLAALVGGLLLGLSILPLARLFGQALTPAVLTWLGQSTRVRTALSHSLIVSTSVALLTPLAALGLVFLLEKTTLFGHRWLKLLLFIPLVIPPQILTIAWLSWAGGVGYLHRFVQGVLHTPKPLWTLYGPGGIIFLLVLFALPVAYLTLATGLQQLPRAFEEAARLEGATVWTTWYAVTLPLLWPHIAAATTLSFLAALGNFGIQALLGIPARYLTLPTLIYQKVTSFASGGFADAAGLALLLAVLAVALWFVQAAVVQPRVVSVETWLEPPLRYHLPLPLNIVLSSTAWLVVGVGLSVGPFVAMVLTAFRKAYGVALRWHTVGWDNFSFILFELDSFRSALRHSLLLASTAALGTAFLALLLGYLLIKLPRPMATILQLATDLPYALPGLVFALALVGWWLKPPGVLQHIELYGTLPLLFIAYLGHYLAFALQPIAATWQQMNEALEEAARLDGAGLAAQLWYIFLPLLRPALATGFGLVFLHALSELSLSALLAGSRTETLGWLVFGLEQAGSSGPASALSVLIVTVIAGLFGIVKISQKVGRR